MADPVSRASVASLMPDSSYEVEVKLCSQLEVSQSRTAGHHPLALSIWSA